MSSLRSTSLSRTCLRKKTHHSENEVERSVEDVCLNEADVRDQLPVFCAASLSRVLVLPDEMSDLAGIKKDLLSE